MKSQNFLILSLFLLLSPFSINAKVIGKSIALINGEAIFLSEFEANWDQLLDQKRKVSKDEKISEAWRSENRKLLLDQMIEEKLLVQEAIKQGIKIPKRQLEEGILQVKNRFKKLPPGTKPNKDDFERKLTKRERKEFLKELESQNVSEEEFEKKIKDQMRVLRLTEEEVRAKVPLPFKDSDRSKNPEEREINSKYEKDARALFEKIKKKVSNKNFDPNQDDEVDQLAVLIKSKFSEMVRARHILIKSSRDDDFKTRSKALNKIKAIKKKLDKGKDFIDLAKSESQGPSSKNGGDLGYFTKGQMVPPFEKVAFSLPVGGVSGVVETQFGYHIIRVEEKKAAKRLRFDDIKVDLAGYLYQKRGQEQYDVYVADLRKNANVKILMDLGKDG